MTTTEAIETQLDLKVGDLVEVRSAAEILATLDERGELDSLPFMPEMLKFCGQRMTVFKVAHKACDTINRSGIRRMENAVHLTGARCDGGGHDGCQAACLIYWKHAWLRKLDKATASPSPLPPSRPGQPVPVTPQPAADAPRLLPLLTVASRGPAAEDGSETYRCQATELLRAAPSQLPAREIGQYFQDVRTGNVTALWSLRAFLVMLYNRAQGVSKKVLPARLRWRGGRQWGYLRGRATGPTPTGTSDLRPGDRVRVKSRAEIEPTLNADLLNRGMGFDAEMARLCGRTATVARRVDHIIDEHNGKMLNMRNPCIVLEGVVCEGAYNASCPRAIPPYFREIWLEKLDPQPGQAGGDRDRTGTPQAVLEAAE
jgi:hypothetical protein